MCSYNLKYNDYNANISEGFQSLLATSDISDITLAVEGKFFRAHQVILSLFSPYFRELFCTNPSKHTIFFMKNVKYKIMQDLLAFMYEGKVQIPEEDFNLFWETAKELKIKGLSEDGEPPCNNSKSEEPVQIVEENVSSIAQARKNASDNNEESEEARHSLKRQADFSPTVPGGATIKQSKISLPLPQTDEIGLESSSIDLSQNLASGDLYDEHNHSGMANANIQVKQEFVDNWQTSDENISIQNKGEDMDSSDMDLCVGLKWEEEENRMNNLGHASNMDNGQVFPSGTQVVHSPKRTRRKTNSIYAHSPQPPQKGIVCEEEFNIAVQAVIKNRRKSAPPVWTREKLEETIAAVEQYQRAAAQSIHDSKHDYYGKKYILVRLRAEKVLFMKPVADFDPVKQVIPTQDYYTILRELHGSSHAGKERMRLAIKEQHLLIPFSIIQVFIKLCPICRQAQFNRGNINRLVASFSR